jgi:hypothetical protein
MRYLEDIRLLNDYKSMYALLKDSSMKVNYHTALKRFVSGKSNFAKYIQVDMFIRLYSQHKVPFDMSLYLREYEQLFPS